MVSQNSERFDNSGGLWNTRRAWTGIDTFGRMIGVTRQTIINDDLGFIQEYGPLLGQAAGRSLNDLVWSTIMGGEAAGFFDSSNSNLLEASSDLDIASLTLGIATMKKQVDARGYSIDNTPIALAVPVELEMTARSLLNSTEIVAVTAACSGETGCRAR